MEKSLWDYLAGLLPQRGHYSRIESHDTCPGYPDVHYVLEGIEGTIELKDSRTPTAAVPFAEGGLRKAQLMWMRDCLDAGGRVLVAARVGRLTYLLEDAQAIRLNRITQGAFSRFATAVLVPGERAESSEKLRAWLVKKPTFSTRTLID